MAEHLINYRGGPIEDVDVKAMIEEELAPVGKKYLEHKVEFCKRYKLLTAQLEKEEEIQNSHVELQQTLQEQLINCS